MGDEPKPVMKKKKGRKLLFIGTTLLLVGGGAAGATFYVNNSNAGHSEPDRPKLVLRDGVPASEADKYASPTGDKRADPTKFQATYYPLESNFTANLNDGGGFLQVALAVSTYYDEGVVENLKHHEMAIRSAVLLALSEHDSVALSTPAGKEALKASLRTAINDVLKKKEGFGGVDDVHFTSFVVQ